MNKAITANKLCKVDIKSKKSPQDPNNMDIGTATKSLLSKLHTVSDKSNWYLESNVVNFWLPQYLKFLNEVP